MAEQTNGQPSVMESNVMQRVNEENFSILNHRMFVFRRKRHVQKAKISRIQVNMSNVAVIVEKLSKRHRVLNRIDWNVNEFEMERTTIFPIIVRNWFDMLIHSIINRILSRVRNKMIGRTWHWDSVRVDADEPAQAKKLVIVNNQGRSSVNSSIASIDRSKPRYSLSTRRESLDIYPYVIIIIVIEIEQHKSRRKEFVVDQLFVTFIARLQLHVWFLLFLSRSSLSHVRFIKYRVDFSFLSFQADRIGSGRFRQPQGQRKREGSIILQQSVVCFIFIEIFSARTNASCTYTENGEYSWK